MRPRHPKNVPLDSTKHAIREFFDICFEARNGASKLFGYLLLGPLH